MKYIFLPTIQGPVMKNIFLPTMQGPDMKNIFLPTTQGPCMKNSLSPMGDWSVKSSIFFIPTPHCFAIPYYSSQKTSDRSVNCQQWTSTTCRCRWSHFWLGHSMGCSTQSISKSQTTFSSCPISIYSYPGGISPKHQNNLWSRTTSFHSILW